MSDAGDEESEQEAQTRMENRAEDWEQEREDAAVRLLLRRGYIVARLVGMPLADGEAPF